MKWIFILLCLIPSSAFSAGSLTTQPNPSYWSQGNAPLPFNIGCTTTSWTVVSSSDTIARGTIYISDETNSTNICISTTTNVNDLCNASTPGIDLSAGGSWTDYSEAGWNCRGKTPAGTPATVTDNIHGVRYRDKGDYGSISAVSR